jgi:hypothetical protein
LPARHVAHFLMKLMCCMFAEDIDLRPKKLFERTVEASKGDPKKLTKMLRNLFAAMAKSDYFGADEILFFNGDTASDARSMLNDPFISALHRSFNALTKL